MLPQATENAMAAHIWPASRYLPTTYLGYIFFPLPTPDLGYIFFH